jgi:hypothetical protein
VAQLALACQTPKDEATNDQKQPIIGGFDAVNAALDHTGLLVALDPVSKAMEPVCTVTLLSAETVVTAKHCAEVLYYIPSGWKFAVALGANAETPEEVIEVVAVDVASPYSGGFSGLGSDVAIMHLDVPSGYAGSFPVPRPSSELAEGRSMVTLGYGVFGASGTFDMQRRIGRERVEATSGLALEIIFGDFESFVEWVFTGQVTDEDIFDSIDEDDPFVALLLEEYESIYLLDDYEAVTGLAPRDTQSCYGDSGSPLLRLTREGVWETYGVVSGGFNSLRSVCDFGTVFSTFGPEALAFVQEGLQWEDPCGDVPTSGICDGNIATTCTTDVLEGIREVDTQDCEATGEQCFNSSLGALCGTPGVPQATGIAAEPIPDGLIERLVREAYIRQLNVKPRWER